MTVSSYLELTVITVATKICTADLSSLLKIVMISIETISRYAWKLNRQQRKNKQPFKAGSKTISFPVGDFKQPNLPAFQRALLPKT